MGTVRDRSVVARIKDVLRIALATVLIVAATVQAAVPTPPRALTRPTSITSVASPVYSTTPLKDLSQDPSIAGAVWADGGRSVVYSSSGVSGQMNLWKIPAAGGSPQRLTSSERAELFLASSVDGKQVSYSADHGGNGLYDLFMVQSSGGPVRNLTKTDDVSEKITLFSPDCRLIAYSRKPKDESSWNVAVMDLSTGGVRVLTHEPDARYSWNAVAWMPDGTSILANRYGSGFKQVSAWRIDASTGATLELTPGSPDRRTSATAVSPNRRLIAITSNRASDVLQAGFLDISTGSYHWLKPSPWQQSAGAFSSDGNLVSFVTDEDGRRSTSIADLRSSQIHEINAPGGGTNAFPEINAPGGGTNAFPPQGSGFAPDSKSVLLLHQSAANPPEVWIAQVDGTPARQLTHLSAVEDTASIPPAQTVHYASFDGTVISAFLWVPFNLRRDRSAPAVVMVHGGPYEAWEDTFDPLAVALAQRGFVVIAPNVRGSSGYGDAFEFSNVKDLGGGDLKDEIYATRFLVASGYVDANRIGITGHSYGGYMTLMALGKSPNTFAAGVERSGIIDWMRLVTTTSMDLRQYIRFLLGDPVKDRAVYERSSPLAYVGKIQSPLLVLQGENDPIVPKSQAVEVVTELKRENRTVNAHFYPNEGHVFTAEDNIDSLERTVQWFEQYLSKVKL
jgi:dipeptidyl aminopeptidase/acylaminoacyl peptidase